MEMVPRFLSLDILRCWRPWLTRFSLASARAVKMVLALLGQEEDEEEEDEAVESGLFVGCAGRDC